MNLNINNLFTLMILYYVRYSNFENRSVKSFKRHGTQYPMLKFRIAYYTIN